MTNGEQKKSEGPILPRRGEKPWPHVLPTAEELKGEKSKFDGKIKFCGYDALANTAEYLYQLGIGRPWREARGVLSLDRYLGPKIKALKGEKEAPKEVPPKPEGGKYRSRNLGGIDHNLVYQRAYKMLFNDLAGKGYRINDEASFDDPDILGHEDGAGNIRLSCKLRENPYKKLTVLAHESLGHGYGEPYGRDEDLARKYIKRAYKELDGQNSGRPKVTDLKSYRKGSRRPSILPALKAA